MRSLADQALDAYRDMIGRVGQDVAIRRYSGTGAGRNFVDTLAKAYVRNFGSKELVGSVALGDQSAVMLVDTLTAILPVWVDDKLVVDGSEFAIKNVMKRVVAGELIALEIHASG